MINSSVQLTLSTGSHCWYEPLPQSAGGTMKWFIFPWNLLFHIGFPSSAHHWMLSSWCTPVVSSCMMALMLSYPLPPSFFLVYSHRVLDLGLNLPCTVRSCRCLLFPSSARLSYLLISDDQHWIHVDGSDSVPAIQLSQQDSLLVLSWAWLSYCLIIIVVYLWNICIVSFK